MDERASQVERTLLRAAVHGGTDRLGFYRTAEAALRRVVGFDGACWITLDPATLLFTNHFSDTLPTEGFHAVCRNEYLEEDFNKVAELAVRRRPFGVLAKATRGRPERSTRYRTLLRPFGLEGELRAALRLDGSTWGTVFLLRGGDAPEFAPWEAATVGALAPTLAHGFRSALVPSAINATDPTRAPGLIVLDEDGGIDAVTPAGEGWLQELRGDEPAATGPVPSSVLAVAASVRRAASEGATADVPSMRLRTASGAWARVHGSLLSTDDGQRIAVIMEPATPADIAPIIVRAYGLTPRQRDVVELVLRGTSTAGIAAHLHVSPWTVQDHLKAVFDKVGVNSRKELVSAVFFQQYEPRITDDPELDATGAFV